MPSLAERPNGRRRPIVWPHSIPSSEFFMIAAWGVPSLLGRYPILGK